MFVGWHSAKHNAFFWTILKKKIKISNHCSYFCFFVHSEFKLVGRLINSGLLFSFVDLIVTLNYLGEMRSNGLLVVCLYKHVHYVLDVQRATFYIVGAGRQPLEQEQSLEVPHNSLCIMIYYSKCDSDNIFPWHIKELHKIVEISDFYKLYLDWLSRIDTQTETILYTGCTGRI